MNMKTYVPGERSTLENLNWSKYMHKCEAPRPKLTVGMYQAMASIFPSKNWNTFSSI